MCRVLDAARGEVLLPPGALIDFPTRSFLDRQGCTGVSTSFQPCRLQADPRIWLRASLSGTSIGAHDTLHLGD